MTYYFIGILPDELSGAFLYEDLEIAKEDLDDFENRENYKIFKITVEECPS